MEWRTVESAVMPLEEDTTSSKVYNYITRNVRTEERTDEEGNLTTWYVYEEAKIPKEAWGLYETQQQQNEDIDSCMVALTEIYEMMEG